MGLGGSDEREGEVMAVPGTPVSCNGVIPDAAMPRDKAGQGAEEEKKDERHAARANRGWCVSQLGLCGRGCVVMYEGSMTRHSLFTANSARSWM